MESKHYDGKDGVGGALEGARSATEGATSTPGGGLADGQRWSAGRKLGVVSRLLGGESLELMSREVGVPIYQLEDWRDKALSGMESALKARAEDPAERKLAKAQRRIGALTMEVELLRERCRRGGGPFVRGRLQK